MGGAGLGDSDGDEEEDEIFWRVGQWMDAHRAHDDFSDHMQRSLWASCGWQAQIIDGDPDVPSLPPLPICRSRFSLALRRACNACSFARRCSRSLPRGVATCFARLLVLLLVAAGLLVLVLVTAAAGAARAPEANAAAAAEEEEEGGVASGRSALASGMDAKGA
jgi:hypothetical protein